MSNDSPFRTSISGAGPKIGLWYAPLLQTFCACSGSGVRAQASARASALRGVPLSIVRRYIKYGPFIVAAFLVVQYFIQQKAHMVLIVESASTKMEIAYARKVPSDKFTACEASTAAMVIDNARAAAAATQAV